MGALGKWFTTDLKRVDWVRTGLLVLLIIAIYVAVMQHLMPEIRTISSTVFRKVPEIRTVETVKRVTVACPESGVVTLDKAEVAEKLNLSWLSSGDIAGAKVDAAVWTKGTETILGTSAKAPAPPDQAKAPDDFDESRLQAETPPVSGNPADLQVTATAELPTSNNGFDVVNVFNTKTGVSDLVATEKTSPWFEFRNKYGLGVRYGVGLGNGPPLHTGTFYGFWEFLRIKDIYATGYGEMTTDSVGKVQMDMQWRPK